MLRKIYIVIAAIFVLIMVLLLILFCGYGPDFNFRALMEYESNNVVIENKIGYIRVSPNSEDEILGNVIFYPGAFVKGKSYLPMIVEIAKNGQNVYIVNSHFNNIRDLFHEENNIFIGHSLGGVRILKKLNGLTDYSDGIKGVILLASYGNDSMNLSNLPFKFISIIGDKDTVVDFDKYENYKNNLPDDTRYVVIRGGNHSNFGNYGRQFNDMKSDISYESQQYIVLEELSRILKGA